MYWDACTFLGLVNQEPGKANDCSSVWREAEGGKTLIYTSFFSFAEVFKVKCSKPSEALSDEDDKKIDDLLRQKWIRPVVVDERIGIAARRLMRHFIQCRKPADGIHLATALRLNVDEMHTFDKSDLLKLDGKVNREDGKPLKICLPYALLVTPEEPGLFDGPTP